MVEENFSADSLAESLFESMLPLKDKASESALPLTKDALQDSVLMAMSGGVDSSVAAALLCEEGYRAIGSTMDLFGAGSCGKNRKFSDLSCNAASDIADAKAVCESLGVDHITFGFADRFKECVIDKFCESYASGGTPNPCVDCNIHLKFSALQEKRRELGLGYVATGHYVRRVFDDNAGCWRLYRAKDKSKDQSYFLYHITQDQLAHTLFPLGDLSKSEVRAIAADKGFSNAEKGESQDICFIPDGDYATFIKSYGGYAGESADNGAICGIGSCSNEACNVEKRTAQNLFSPGEIVDKSGSVLGVHSGLINYTIGQRRGIGVASSEPLYVFAKDIENNRLVVGYASDILITDVFAKDINFVAAGSIEGELYVQAKTHYRQRPVPAVASQEGDRLHVRFIEPVKACSPGQALVLYDGDEVIGGGTITAYR